MVAEPDGVPRSVDWSIITGVLVAKASVALITVVITLVINRYATVILHGCLSA